MDDNWELTYGLNPNDSTNAALDGDGDGINNRDEFLNSSNPLYNPLGYSAAVTAKNPVADWRLDDTTPKLAAAVGGMNGTYTGATSTTPAFPTGGTSASFAGGNVSVPHNAILNPPAECTIEFWARWSGTARGVLYSKVVSAGTSTDVDPLVAANSSGNAASAGRVEFRDSYSKRIVADSSGLNDNAWRHYAFVKRAGKLEIWINGLLDKFTTTSATAYTSTNPLKLMADGTLTVTGALDEVAYFRSALSPLDIKQHYLQGLFVPLSLRPSAPSEVVAQVDAAPVTIIPGEASKSRSDTANADAGSPANALPAVIPAEVSAANEEPGSKSLSSPWLLVDRRDAEHPRAWWMPSSVIAASIPATAASNVPTVPADDPSRASTTPPAIKSSGANEVTDLAALDLDQLDRFVVSTGDGLDLFERNASVRGEFHHQHFGQADPALKQMEIHQRTSPESAKSYSFLGD